MVQETRRERTHLPQKIFIALSGGTAAQTFEVRERFNNQTLRLSKKPDLDEIKIPLLGHCTVKPRLTYTRLIRTVCFVPENIFSNFNPLDTTWSRTQTSLSLDENVRAKKGGKKTTVPFPWSLAVHHQSIKFRARFYHAKNEAPE